ncbi:hypothetical protein BKA82DRAFT_4165027 [Pisolithus tinctorius]|nr:hypothetical protein BKA82DRAFT_4165027 [Pisolithus tinctorius]
MSTSAPAAFYLVGNVVGASPASTAITLESWFPLRSFIDLKAYPGERVSSWKWRSFIEIGVA